MICDYTFRAKTLSQNVTYTHVRVSFITERKKEEDGSYNFCYIIYFRKRKMSTNRLTSFNKRTMSVNNNARSRCKLN
jgi:hypothetical protein